MDRPWGDEWTFQRGRGVGRKQNMEVNRQACLQCETTEGALGYRALFCMVLSCVWQYSVLSLSKITETTSENFFYLLWSRLLTDRETGFMIYTATSHQGAIEATGSWCCLYRNHLKSLITTTQDDFYIQNIFRRGVDVYKTRVLLISRNLSSLNEKDWKLMEFMNNSCHLEKNDNINRITTNCQSKVK